MQWIDHFPDDIISFKQKALQWAASFEAACFYDSNQYKDPYSRFDTLIAAGARDEVLANAGSAFDQLKKFRQRYPHWTPGFLSYDLKNETEALSSDKPDGLRFPDLYFFVPLHIIIIRGNAVRVSSDAPWNIIQAIEESRTRPASVSFNGKITHRFSKKEYVDTVNQLKEHILRGDIYEVNFCQEFYADDAELDPLAAFHRLDSLSSAPFSAFFKHDGKFAISASPERFLSKQGQKVVSQPIKGTARRSADLLQDEALKTALKNDSKELSENVMIVDLVRNDLTKCAVPGSVKVEELFGIYTFKQVHQMISTVVCEAGAEFSDADIIKAAFPMGSMTGAPKLRAMELIEQYERTRRGLFSGALGYFTPEGDFDFNVVIRTLLYNERSRYISFQAGSAITFASEAEKEYDECLLKAKAIIDILEGA